MKHRLLLAAITLSSTTHIAQARAAPVVWHSWSIHAGECVRLSSLGGDYSFLKSGRNPKELLALLKARAPDARLQSFVSAARADRDPSEPKDPKFEEWLKNFSSSNAYMLSSEAADIGLPIITEQLCRKLKLRVTNES